MDARIHEITTVYEPNLFVGKVIMIEREPFFVVEIAHELGTFATSRVRVAEPDPWWTFKFKVRRFLQEHVRDRWRAARTFFREAALHAWRRVRARG